MSDLRRGESAVDSILADETKLNVAHVEGGGVPAKRLDNVIEADELAREGDDAAKALEGQNIDYTPEEERKLKRKMDWILLPMMAVGVGMLLVDKTALGSAATLTLQKDLGLKGSQYSWAVSIYFFGLLVGTYPATMLEQRFHTGRVVGVCYICWGAVMFGTVGVKDYRGLFATRFLLGVLESANNPGFTAITARFYTPEEQPFRYALWAVGNTVAPIPFLVIYYALGLLPAHPLQQWRWIFVVTGSVTVVMGTIIFFFLPDKPSNCRWLTKRQRAVAVARMARSQIGIKSHEFKWWQIKEALLDVKVWIIALMLVCQQPNPAISSSFSGIIIKGYGYSGLKALLLQIPAWAVPCVGTPLIGFLTMRVPALKARKTWVLAAVSVFSLVCEVVLFTNPPLPGANKAIPLTFISLMAIDQSIYPMILTLLGQNIAGSSKKQMSIALVWLMYCLGNILTPLAFKSSESPRYQTGLTWTITAQALLAVLAGLFFVICKWENRRRDRAGHGVITLDTTERELVLAGLEDETDKTNKRVRYLP